ncbi:MAG: acyl-CoA dehydratase activase [Chloroflexota bacterium]
MKGYLGIDVGAATTKFALLDAGGALVRKLYLPTQGNPVAMVAQGLRRLREEIPAGMGIGGVATTGSARSIAGAMVGADTVKNEITCHARGALHALPEAQTVVEIGGQDSKMIILRGGMVSDFGMNTVCAAGTGSFLEHQARRLNLSLEDFSEQALRSRHPARIHARCTVFAESDMVHQQQTGRAVADIIYGLCRTLVGNYLHDVGRGKELLPPVVFQGGVAFNRGIVRALEEALETPVVVPAHHEVSGAIGAALLVREEMLNNKGRDSGFRGFAAGDDDYRMETVTCRECPAQCEIEQLSAGTLTLGSWGGRCEAYGGERNAGKLEECHDYCR